ncbi:MAG TPA: hypothetical protein DIT13_11335, partial [Verrucomicrobiales bacterium]|nr:hypothetical protein [Verrucomicrobiales bacterium]
LFCRPLHPRSSAARLEGEAATSSVPPRSRDPRPSSARQRRMTLERDRSLMTWMVTRYPFEAGRLVERATIAQQCA